MAHECFEFVMPARADVVFDAFHYHCWRARWDTLVEGTHVLGGGACPYVGAITENPGRGLLRSLSMRTRFVAYDRPRVAAAAMVGRSFPFVRWAASMKHRPAGADRSVMVYTYTFEAGPPGLRWLVGPVVKRVFDYQTRRRFGRLQRFLASHADEVMAWQDAGPQVLIK
jgi:hypothetical protein